MEDDGQKGDVFRMFGVDNLSNGADKNVATLGIELTKHYSNLNLKLRSEIDK